jgi:hypothetical protein
MVAYGANEPLDMSETNVWIWTLEQTLTRGVCDRSS